MIGTIWSVAMVTLYSFLFCKMYHLGGARQGALVAISVAQALLLSLMVILFGADIHVLNSLSSGVYFGIVLAYVSVSIGVLYGTSFKQFEKVPQSDLQLAQGFRVVVGAGFLMFGVLGLIPGWFSILDAALHITSGLLALRAAYAIAINSPLQRSMTWVANIVGIADILIIVTTIAFVVWNDLGPRHPMHLVVFGVGPILLWFHFLSLFKLVKKR